VHAPAKAIPMLSARAGAPQAQVNTCSVLAAMLPSVINL